MLGGRDYTYMASMSTRALGSLAANRGLELTLCTPGGWGTLHDGLAIAPSLYQSLNIVVVSVLYP